MFGDLMGMMGKLKEAQESAELVKKRLDSVYVTGVSPDGKVRVVITANSEVKDVILADDAVTDKEELTDLLVVALNRGLEKAKQLSAQETKSAMKDMIPPGLEHLVK